MRKMIILLIIGLVLIGAVAGIMITRTDEEEIGFISRGINMLGTIGAIDKDDVFKELKVNDEVNKIAILTVENPTKEAIPREDIKVNFIEKCGYVKDYTLTMKQECIGQREKERIYDEKEVCTITENNGIENKTNEIETCYIDKTLKEIIYENYTYICFKEFDKIDVGEIEDIKVEVKNEDMVWGDCGDSFGYEIDWQIELKADGETLIKEEWAWWDNTYIFKTNISCDNMDDLTPIVVNGSGGFSIGGVNQIVWTYCSGEGTALYFNDENDYAIANDTIQLPMEVEVGGETSVDYHTIWDDYEVVWHLNDIDTSTVRDSTNNETGVKDGVLTPFQDDGIVGYGQNHTDDAIRSPDDDMDSTTDFWVIEAWILLPTGEDGMVIDKRDSTSDGFHLAPVGGKINCRINAVSHTASTDIYDAWHYVACSYDDVNLYTFVDGSVDDKQSAVNIDTATTTDMKTGTVNYGGTYSFTGKMDEVRLSKKTVNSTVAYFNQTYENMIGTTGYGMLGTQEDLTIPILIGNVTIDGLAVENAIVFIINQDDIESVYNTTTNSTGGWTYELSEGIYLIAIYDPNNSTRAGAIHPFINASL